MSKPFNPEEAENLEDMEKQFAVKGRYPMRTYVLSSIPCGDPSLRLSFAPASTDLEFS
jgi:hypothetical protein